MFFLPAGSSSSLLYLQNTLSSRCFLVDSRASFSVFLDTASSSNCGIHLVTANRSAMTCSEPRIFPLQFGSRRYQWTIQLSPVSVPILVADFHHHHHLLVDIAGEHLLEPSDALPAGESLPTASDPADFTLRANPLSTP